MRSSVSLMGTEANHAGLTVFQLGAGVGGGSVRADLGSQDTPPSCPARSLTLAVS